MKWTLLFTRSLEKMYAYQQLRLYTKKYKMYDAPVLANTFVSHKR